MKSFERLPVHIRWAIRRDMPEVLEIEADSFESPWTEAEFLRVLRQRNAIGMICEREDRIVGFMVYELHKTRLHILNFAVAADVRRRDVGSQMVKKLQSKLKPTNRTRIVLEIRETNVAAQVFFQRHGFKCTSVLRGFYEDVPDDAYLFEYSLPVPAAADKAECAGAR